MKRNYVIYFSLSFLLCQLLVFVASAQPGKVVIKVSIGGQSFQCISANGPAIKASSTINGGAPVQLVKAHDAVDDQLMKLKTIGSGTIEFYKPDASGNLQKIEIISLTNIRLALSQVAGNTHLQLTYNTMTCTWVKGGKPSQDPWEFPAN